MEKQQSSHSSDRRMIFERNPDTGVVRWRYVGESLEKYGWPHYGNILVATDSSL